MTTKDNALTAGHFRDRLAGISDTERWNLEHCYQRALELEPVAISMSCFVIRDEDGLCPSLTPDVPILIAVWNGRGLILDGCHRVAEAKKHNAQYILGYVLNEDLMKELLL
ncbi:MAG TPA: hypothetical protein PLC99_09640 [Verrucomicrobiota bacterium]|nr:hypothetical protein [Verrucomicrobiota bacterium]